MVPHLRRLDPVPELPVTLQRKLMILKVERSRHGRRKRKRQESASCIASKPRQMAPKIRLLWGCRRKAGTQNEVCRETSWIACCSGDCKSERTTLRRTHGLLQGGELFGIFFSILSFEFRCVERMISLYTWRSKKVENVGEGRNRQ